MSETNEERLATTKNSVQYARKFIGDNGVLSFQYGKEVLDDFDWVLEQAVRVQETEEQKEFFRRSLVEIKAAEVISRKENMKLREANDELQIKNLELEMDKELLRLALEGKDND